MKNNNILLNIMLIMFLSFTLVFNQEVNHYPIEPIPFTSIDITDQFWAPRIQTNYEVTIPIAIEQCYKSGRVENFKIAGKLKEGKFCSQYPFDDTDVYKLIEAASYSLQTIPDENLESKLDTLISYIELAQEPDGYLFTNRTIDSLNLHDWVGKKRWEKTPDLSHELYNCGHLYEAAVAHYLATGKTSLLNIATKNANLLVKVFLEGGLKLYPGHQIVEMALVRLYGATDKKEYLDLAKYFLDIRGPNGEEYHQGHKKVIDQTKAVGHSVRATYMYSGMADIAAIYNDSAYIKATRNIWEDIVHKKMYVTGGIGSGSGNEGFDPEYVLPNMSAYCETCASVGNIFWNQRMFLYDGSAKYIDVLERTLYNALLSGVSLSGDHFFYPNVLASIGQHSRSKWFGCACCPPNIARLLPSLPGYIYAKNEDKVFVNLFINNSATFEFCGQKLQLIQDTKYPWEGDINITVNPEDEKEFSLMIRIPGWARNEATPGNLYSFVNTSTNKCTISINGVESNYNMLNGYALLKRMWKKGDQVEIQFPMEVRKLISDKRVTENKERIAIQRGPIVYCAEWPYAKDEKVLSLVFDKNEPFLSSYDSELLNGVYKITCKASLAKRQEDNSIMNDDPQDITLIPYFAWNNNGPGEMEVWLSVSNRSVRPLPLPTIASKSKVSASKEIKSLLSVQDQLEPKNSNDRTSTYFHWWPTTSSTEWIQYDFEKEETISSSSVYWFDDGPWGGCRIPDFWEVQFKKGDEWVTVNNLEPYEVIKDSWNKITFEPVKTKSVRLKAKLNEKFSSGVHEWIVE